MSCKLRVRRQVLPDDERAAIERHLRELDRLGEDLAVLGHEIAEATVDDPAVRRLLTVAGINVTVAAGLVAAIGDIRRFSSPQKLVSYSVSTRGSGNPGLASPSMAGSARSAGRTPGRCWSRPLGRRPRRRPLARVLCAHPKPTRSSDRRGRDRTQDGGSGLAPARQGRRLCLGASGARRAQAAGTRTPGRQAHARRAIDAAPRMPTTSRRSGTRRWRSPNRPSTPMSTSWRSGDRSPQRGVPEPHR